MNYYGHFSTLHRKQSLCNGVLFLTSCVVCLAISFTHREGRREGGREGGGGEGGRGRGVVVNGG